MGDVSNLNVTWRSALMLALCLPILLNAVFIYSKKVERAATLFLCFFLLAIVVNMIPQIIGFAGFYNVWPDLTFAPFNTELFLGPLIYLHAFKLMSAKPLGWRKYLLLPGIVQIIYYTSLFVGFDNYQDKWTYSKTVHAPYIIPIETTVSIGLGIFALCAIYQMIKRYQDFLLNSHSTASDFDPVWLRYLLWGFLIAFIPYAWVELVSIFSARSSYVYNFGFLVLSVVIILWMALVALMRLQDDYPKINTTHDAVTRHDSDNNNKDWSTEAQLLAKKITEQKWFLEPRLSLRQLAERMATNESYISRTVNQGIGKTFNRYINEMRVEHAKTLIEKTRSPLLNVALDSGFNSKATFNRVFKEIAQETPSMYRKRISH